jgi:AcrR family transcriptional regulator
MVSWGDDRARIRRALIDLCWERGFASLTLNDLLERAEVDEATFLRFFADAEDCFFQVYRAELERFRQERTAASIGFIAWRDRLRATAYAMYRFLAADEKIRHLTAAEVRAGSERSQLLIGQEVEALFDLIDEGRAERPEGETLTRSTAETIGGGIFNQIYSAAGQKGPMPVEAEIVPELMYLSVLPYAGEPAAREELAEPPSDHRRSPVFGALIDLCWERDVTDVTVDDLVARSGIERAEFERRFGDVDGCLCQFFEAEKAVMLHRLATARAGQSDWRSRLRATAYELLAFLREDARAAKLTSVDVRMASEQVRLNWAATFVRFVEYVDEANAELPEDRQRGREVAESVTGGIFQQLWSRLGARGELPDPRKLVPELMYMAVLPYFGEAAAREELTMPSPDEID